ncbi:MAG: hypothetical protein ABRQ27_04790 [Clostridiaceae bacterium]
MKNVTAGAGSPAVYCYFKVISVYVYDILIIGVNTRKIERSQYNEFKYSVNSEKVS